MSVQQRGAPDDGGDPAALDFHAIFEAAPGIHLVLAPDPPRFTMLAASDARLAATLATREETVGQPLFEVFADANPENPEPSGVANLRASLETVLLTGAEHRMAVQRYDLRRPDGGWEVRYWAPRNVPVLAPDGAVRCIVHHVQDVTDLVLEREATAAAERRTAELRAVLESMSDGVLIGSVDGISLANRAALRQLGYARPEELHRRIGTLADEVRTRDAASGAAIPIERHAFMRALAGERVVQDLLVRHRVTGEDRVMHCVAAPVVVGGAVIAAVTVHTDVTDARRADAEHERLVAELHAERERLRALIRLMPAPVALHTGPEHRFALLSDGFRRVSGGRDLIGMTPQEAYPEIVGHGILERFDEVVATGEPWVSRETYVRFDRSGDGVEDSWFDIRYEPVRDGAGRVTGVLNFSLDVTEQVRARREIEAMLVDSERARTDAEAARARADAVLRSIADAFYLLDREWRFTFVNDAAEPLLQTTREALLGRTLWEAFPEVTGSPFEGPYREAMTTGRPTSAEAYFPPLGTWFDVRSYPWSGGLMVHFRDIGARKAAEAERERLLAETEAARRDAEAANRAKSEFLAVMSHELRTPLNAIGGYAELIEMGIHGPVTNAQRTALERIQRSQRHLLGLIAGVLDYSRLEAGAVAYDLADVPVVEAVAEAEALVAPQLRAKGLGYGWSGAVPGLTVRADREKLQQILLNLLSNAVKFTHARDGVPGRVEVSCRVDEDAPGRRVCIQVRDTGEGIAPEKLEHVFEPFVQVDQRLTREHQGVGLGLAISRDLARGMGGDLTATSTLGVGSTLSLSLPLGSASGAGAP
ncbi:MAG: PAS domain-containing sensor histidine kinase [Gemmatirosa sp.]